MECLVLTASFLLVVLSILLPKSVWMSLGLAICYLLSASKSLSGKWCRLQLVCLGCLFPGTSNREHVL